MKRYFFSGRDSTFLRLTIFLCFVSFYTSGTNITIAPYLIQFNYNTTSYSNDALTVRNEIGESITEPEWAPDEGINEPAAYIKNQDSIKIRVWFESNYSGSVHLIVKLSVSAGNGIGTVCNLFIPNYVTNSDFVDIQLTGSLPNFVGKHTFTWNWEIYAIPVSSSSYCAAWDTTSTTHTYYTVLTAPQAPMAQPWTSVLDYACDWAEGLQEEESCIYWITNSLYSSGVEYNGSEHYTKNSFTNLDLKSLISDFSDPESMQMDCRDFSNFLHVLTNALGITVQYNRINMECYYNYLFPAGWTSRADPGYWSYHQVGWYNLKVADAATKIDNDQYPNDGTSHSWRLPVGDMTLPNYLEKLTESDVNSEATGICTVY